MTSKFFSLALACVLTLSVKTYSQNVYFNNEAKQYVKNSKSVRISKHSKNIESIIFDDASTFISKKSSNKDLLENTLKLKKDYEFKLAHSKTDHAGFKYEKFTQTYNGIPIYGRVYTLHYKNDRLVKANGKYINIPITDTKAKVDINEAFFIAKNEVNGETYIWDNDEDFNLNSISKLIILPLNDTVAILAYQFDIFSTQPLSRYYIFVDATTGDIVKKISRIHDTDHDGTAETLYNGTQTIKTEYSSGTYKLKESGRGGGIYTYDLNNTTNYASAVDFTDADNYWNTTSNYDNAAYDVHYGTEKTYDYYYHIHSRNSYDDLGSTLVSYVHYSNNYVNAFWNGSYMTYGDGNSTEYTPLTCTDIVGHEITHGVTEHSAGLEYSYESGALNESFSDIFGTCVDFYANPTTANWIVGEQISSTSTPIRSLKNPNSQSQPDTYKGTYWYTGSGDHGGVHYNSGVQNFWFYLLVNGGSGTNDKGDAYSVTGIGIDKAAQIAYRNLTAYLTPTSQYSDARYYSIQSAEDLYGACSPEVIATTNAWHAVGVGTKYNDAVIAEFSSSKTYSCSTPTNIVFSNISTNASSYLWNFGDGTTSTSTNPTHTYNTSGTYTVSLTAYGSSLCNSSNNLTKTNYITIDNIGGPIAASCTPNTTSPGSNYGIFNFQLNTINNTTAGAIDGYQDYSCSYNTSLVEGEKYLISITTHNSYAENVYVWLDFNNDGSFNQTNELIYTSLNTVKTHSDSIIIPKGSVYNTPIRLRVGSDYYSYKLSSACDNSYAGQYEDYSITLIKNTSAPKADITTSNQAISTEQNIQFKDWSTNIPTSWEWHFEGGTPASSSIQNPIVQYTTEGNFDVKLIVSNANGTDSIYFTDFIHVNNTFNMCHAYSTVASSGKLYDSGGPTGNYGYYENCSFLISPQCADTIVFKFNNIDLEDCCDRISIYDGESIGDSLLGIYTGSSIPSIIKATSGSIFITFYSNGSLTYSGFNAEWYTIMKSGISTDAQFSISDLNPPINTETKFTDQSTPAPISWLWDFGDGNTSIEQHPIHKYNTSGNHTISLNINTCYGTDSSSSSITVQDPPEISVVTDTIHAYLFTGDSIVKTLPIGNITGNGELVIELKPNLVNSPAINDLNIAEIFANKSKVTGYTINKNTIEYAVNYSYNLEGIEYSVNENILTSVSNEFEGITVFMPDNYKTSFGLELELKGANVHYSSSLYNTDILDTIDVLIVSDYFISIEQSVAVNEWLKEGGNIIIDADQSLSIFNSIISGTEIEYQSISCNSGTTTNINKHELTDSILSYEIGTSSLASLIVAGEKNILIKDISGNIFAAYANLEHGKALLLGDESIVKDNINQRRLGLNAINWFKSNKTDWLTMYSKRDTISSGISYNKQLTFKAQSMYGGDYFGSLALNTNDTANPVINIPIHLNVTGAPVVKIESDTITFDTSFVNYTTAEEITISNIGTDVLIIDSITFSSENFSIDSLIDTLNINENFNCKINFNSSVEGSSTDSLFIYQNSYKAIDTFLIKTYNSLPPVMSVIPDSFYIKLFSSDTLVENLTIDNSLGNYRLEFGISIVDNPDTTGIESILKNNPDITEYSVDGNSIVYEIKSVIENEDETYSQNKTINTSLSNDLSGVIVLLPELGSLATELQLRGARTYYYNYVIPASLDTVDILVIEDGKLFLADAPIVNNWIKNGGNLLIDADNDRNIFNEAIKESGIEYTSTYCYSGVTNSIFTHPITNGITQYYIGSSAQASLNISGDATVVIKDVSDHNFAGAAQLGNGKVVALCDETINNYGTNQQELILNAINWFASSRNWMKINTLGDTVSSGLSEIIPVHFNVQGLQEGDYFKKIIITSNDPAYPVDTVPVHITVKNAPNIMLSSDSLIFKSYTNYSISDTLWISNNGTESLSIQDIICDTSIFTIDTNSFVITPGNKYPVQVTFLPGTSGIHSAHLSILSNDSSNLNTTVNLKGLALTPPIFTPDSFDIELLSGDTLTKFLAIDNISKVSDLEYSISVKGKDDSYSPISNNDLFGKVIMLPYGQTYFSNNLKLRGAKTYYYSYFNTLFLDTIDVVVLNDSYFSTSYSTEVNNWIKEGGNILIDGDSYYLYNDAIKGSGIEYSSVDCSYGITTSIFKHEITDTITQYFIGYASASLIVNEDAKVLVKDMLGRNFAATAKLGKGKIVAFSDETINYSNTNQQELALNAVSWLANEVSWIKIDSLSGVILSDSSLTIPVKFNAANLNEGDYEAGILVYGKNPDILFDTISVHMFVDGAPNIVVSEDSLSFKTYAGYTSTDTLLISNNGTDTLRIQNIISDTNLFTVDTNNFAVAPGKKRAIKVMFSPDVSGVVDAHLIISSNDSSNLDATINLKGNTLEPPILSPDSFDIELLSGDTLTRTLTIDNTSGTNDLHYRISIENKENTYLADNYLDGKNVMLPYGQTYFSNNLISKGAKTSFYSYFNPSFLDTIDVLILRDGYFSTSYSTVLSNWIKEGGSLLIDDDDSYTYNTIIQGSGIKYLSTSCTYGITNSIFKHEITDTITKYQIRYAYSSLDVTGDAEILVKDLSGNNFAAATKFGKGKIVAFSGQTINYSYTNQQELALNAVNWLANDISWMRIDSLKSTIPTGSSLTLPVQFNAEYLNEGNYKADILIYGKDPDVLFDTIPVNMFVDGAPNIVVSADSLLFKTYVGYTSTDTLLILNNGTDTLRIQNIISDTNLFTIDTNKLVVTPGKKRAIKVIFSPNASGVVDAHLIISSNDSSNLNTTINLKGNALEPPILGPDSFDIELLSGDTLTKSLTIDNTSGTNDLHYRISIENKENTYLADNYLDGKNVMLPYGQTYFSNNLISKGAKTSFYSYFNPSFLDTIDVLIIRDGYFSTSYSTVLSNWIKEGGNLLIDDDDSYTYNTIIQGSGIKYLNTSCTYGITNSIFKHEITDTITKYQIRYAYSSLDVTGDAEILVKDLSGNNFAAATKFGKGKIVAFSGQTINYSYTNQQELALNAVNWLANDISWMRIDSLKSTILAGANLTLPVRFNAEHLNEGDYNADILIYGKDPDILFDTIPVHMFVKGEAILHTSTSSINFGSIYNGGTKSYDVTFSNIGTKALVIDSIKFLNNLYFNHSIDTFIIDPGEEITKSLTYSPVNLGSHSDQLFIYSNDTLNPTTIINVSGSSIESPKIKVTPNSLYVTLSKDKSTERTINISNISTGDSSLNYNITGSDAFIDSLVSTKYYTYIGETTSHIFNNITTQVDSIVVQVKLNGDYTSFSEYATIEIEGNDYGRINDVSFPDNTDYTRLYSFSSSEINGWLSDNKISIYIHNSTGVDPGYGQQLNQVKLSLYGCTWLSLDKTSGKLNSGANNNINITFDAHDLNTGLHFSNLYIHSNDAGKPKVTIPINLEVSETNRPPVIISAIPNMPMMPGDSISIDLSKVFSDPDNDALTYSALTGNSSITGVHISSSMLNVFQHKWGKTYVDVIAKDSYSDTVSLRFYIMLRGYSEIENLENPDMELTTYPNPFTEQLHMLYTPTSTGTITINLCNTLGEILKTQTTNVTYDNRTTVTIDAGDIPTGIYYLTIIKEKSPPVVVKVLKE